MIEAGFRHEGLRELHGHHFPDRALGGVSARYCMTIGTDASFKDIRRDDDRTFIGFAEAYRALARRQAFPGATAARCRGRQRVTVALQVARAVVTEQDTKCFGGLGMRKLSLGLRRIELKAMTVGAMLFHGDRLKARASRLRRMAIRASHDDLALRCLDTFGVQVHFVGELEVGAFHDRDLIQPQALDGGRHDLCHSGFIAADRFL